MSGDGPRLSIVIPSFNTAALTMRCLETAQAAASQGVEIIVVDDGSTDSSVESLRRLGDRILLIQHPRQMGFTAAASTGLERATGDVILLLNSDTEVTRPGLESLMRAYEADPRLGIAGAELRFPDGRAQWSGGRQPSLLWLLMLTSGLPGLLARLPGYRRLRPVSGAEGRRVAWVPGAAMAIRSTAWKELAPLDDRFSFYCQDLDLCIRAREAGWQVGVAAGFEVVHHVGASIGTQAGIAAERCVPELLWTDLLLWAAKARGTAWASRAGRVMRVGAGLRLVGRWLCLVLFRAGRRPGWREETAAFRSGRDALPAGGPASIEAWLRAAEQKGEG